MFQAYPTLMPTHQVSQPTVGTNQLQAPFVNYPQYSVTTPQGNLSTVGQAQTQPQFVNAVSPFDASLCKENCSKEPCICHYGHEHKGDSDRNACHTHAERKLLIKTNADFAEKNMQVQTDAILAERKLLIKTNADFAEKNMQTKADAFV